MSFACKFSLHNINTPKLPQKSSSAIKEELRSDGRQEVVAPDSLWRLECRLKDEVDLPVVVAAEELEPGMGCTCTRTSFNDCRLRLATVPSQKGLSSGQRSMYLRGTNQSRKRRIKWQSEMTSRNGHTPLRRQLTIIGPSVDSFSWSTFR